MTSTYSNESFSSSTLRPSFFPSSSNSSDLDSYDDFSNATNISSSCELYQPQSSTITVPLYGYAMPILLVITTTANTLIVLVLSQRTMRTPSNTILLAISLADLCTLIVPAPMFFYMYTLGYYQSPLSQPIFCYIQNFLSDVIPTLFHSASIWLTLALAAQRYIYICHSPAARIMCTQPRVVKMIVCIFLAATIYQSTRFFEYVYVQGELMYEGKTISACFACYPEWLMSFGLNTYYAIYFWIRVIFVHLLPCTLLVVLNGLLYRALREAQRTRNRLLQENRRNESKRIREKNCTTMMLIVIVSIFLVTEIPLAIITFLHILTNSGIIQIFSQEHYVHVQKFFIISNFFIICTYPLNFAIYCGMSRQFRDTFALLFLRSGKSTRYPREDSSRYSTMNGHRTSETIL